MPACPLSIPADHPAFAGHFPGHPIVPGVVLLDHAQAAIELTTGQTLGGLAQAKFLRVVTPGEALELRFEPGAGCVKFSVHAGDHAVATGRFDLVRAQP
ncbi:3-hydroxyacyl-ACP dehydratase FabZ family protein [Aquabacterium sp.]|uniref:3-hydroxyacyl-ACP dehydratase FabZ family protein n=1 Tax=Aquabacterium sp. TaxID=1872578 RepID=UPI0035B47ADE